MWPFCKENNSELKIVQDKLNYCTELNSNMAKRAQTMKGEYSQLLSDNNNLSKAIALITSEMELLRSIPRNSLVQKNPLSVLKPGKAYHGYFTLRTETGLYKKIYPNGNYYLDVTPLYEILISTCDGQEDSPQEAMDKILAKVQVDYGYSFDQSQWGSSEDWNSTRALMVTMSDDCETLASAVVNAYNYYKLKYNKFSESEAVLGLGLYGIIGQQTYGHGFPVLIHNVNSTDLFSNWFVGEATLNKSEPMRPLGLCKERYRLNWGLISWNYEGYLKDEYKWWPADIESTENTSKTTGGNAMDYLKSKPQTEEELKKKKKAIESFWK